MKLIIQNSFRSFLLFNIMVLLCLNAARIHKNNVVDLPQCDVNTQTFNQINISGGSNDQKWGPECDASITKDFDTRDKLEEYKPCKEVDTWGPRPNVYPPIDNSIIPKTCDINLWQQKRVVALIDKFVKKGWNYCHHHTPSWPTPIGKRVAIDPANIAGDGGSDGVCSKAGISPDNQNGWNGIDCTHYTSWIYNYGFGASLVSQTGNQACGPDAPGKILDVNVDQLEQLRPGDLLYIGKTSSAFPLEVSHGILWTGIKLQESGPFSLDVLINNLPDNQKTAVKNDVDKLKKDNKIIYIISDSHYAGPNYRIFAGWWMRGFTHARRIIGEKPAASSPNMEYNGKVCKVSIKTKWNSRKRKF